MLHNIIKYPGSWVQKRETGNEEYDLAEVRKFVPLIGNMEMELSIATSALLKFIEAKGNVENTPNIGESMKRQDIKSRRINIVEQEVKIELSQYLLNKYYDDMVRNEALRRIMIEDLELGILPRDIVQAEYEVYARSFIFAVESLRKIFMTAANINGGAAAGAAALAVLITGLPDLVGVRDSLAHSDERALGQAKRAPIPNVPLNNRLIVDPNGTAMFMGWMGEDAYGLTMADGHVGSVPINEASLKLAFSSAQKFADTLQWIGRPRIWPN